MLWMVRVNDHDLVGWMGHMLDKREDDNKEVYLRLIVVKQVVGFAESHSSLGFWGVTQANSGRFDFLLSDCIFLFKLSEESFEKLYDLKKYAQRGSLFLAPHGLLRFCYLLCTPTARREVPEGGSHATNHRFSTHNGTTGGGGYWRKKCRIK